jgi:hypothetical protein
MEAIRSSQMSVHTISTGAISQKTAFFSLIDALLIICMEDVEYIGRFFHIFKSLIGLLQKYLS